MTQPGRKFTQVNSEYKYGFVGKEKDNSMGEGGYDFGARIYDSRIGRWLATDPHEIKYASFSPYHYAANNPIFNLDVAGKFVIPYKKGTPEYKAAIIFINYIRTEVNSWSATDPKWQAFQDLTGTTSKKELLKVLKNGQGPEFNWGTGSVTAPDGTFLMRGNGQGFVPNSSYALTTGTKKITFDEGLMAITLKVDDLKNSLATGLNSTTISNALGSGTIQGAENIKKQIAKAEKFLTQTGVHELTHEEYNRNGINANLDQSNTDQVTIPITPSNINLFGSNLFRGSDPASTSINVERGDAMENAMSGTVAQYTNSGIIPLLQYTLQSIWCQLPRGDCFPTEAARNASRQNTTTQQQQAIDAELK